MKTENPNRSLAAALMALTLALAPTPAAAQQTTCSSALSATSNYISQNGVNSLDANNINYRGCCLLIRTVDASREAVRICEVEGVNNQELRDVQASLAGLPTNLSPSACNAQPGGSSSCSEYPAVSLASTNSPNPVSPPVISVPTINRPDSGDDFDDALLIAGGTLVGIAVLVALGINPLGDESGFVAQPILSFQNDDGESLARYGARIEYRRPDSPFSLRWSAEGLRGGGSDSMSALFGGEWRGEVWTLGGEAAQRDSDIAFALRVGTAFERAGWTLRLDAESAAWRDGAHGFASDAELLLGMERAF